MDYEDYQDFITNEDCCWTSTNTHPQQHLPLWKQLTLRFLKIISSLIVTKQVFSTWQVVKLSILMAFAIRKSFHLLLTLSWRRSLSYRNQSIDLQSKLIDWFLYNRDLRHERVKDSRLIFQFNRTHKQDCLLYPSFRIITFSKSVSLIDGFQLKFLISCLMYDSSKLSKQKTWNVNLSM